MAYNTKDKTYTGYIYCITNMVNGKKYIGQTRKTIQRRFSLHISDAKRGIGYAIHAAIRKYGEENFCVEEIERIVDSTKDELVKKLDDREVYWIAEYDTYLGFGYNESEGGSFGRSLCKEKYVPVDVYDLDKNLLYQFESINMASEATGVDDTSIVYCCKGKTKICDKQYVFRYKGDSFDKFDIKYNVGYTVYQLNFDGSVFREYNSLKNASEITGYSYDNLRGAIKYGRPYNGYFWSKTKILPEYNVYDNRMPIDKYDAIGNLLGEYPSVVEGGRSIGKDKDAIQSVLKCCRGGVIHAYGYIWRFHGEPFDKYDTEIKAMPKAIFNLYKNGLYIKTCYGQTELKRFDDIKFWKFKENMGKQIHDIEDYSWYYINDPMQPDKTKIKTINQFYSEQFN